MSDSGRPRLDLEVRVYGELVGRLHRDREGRTRFTPDAEWMERGQHPPLGWAFLAEPGPRLAGTGLPSWFDNLLPEMHSALRRRICHERGLRDTDSAGLLCALGRDLPGAVEVSGDTDGTDDSSAQETAPGRLRFSLAGMQLKLSMVQSGDRFALPARDESGKWIIKLPGERFPELPEVEAATMDWAHESGLPVPIHQVLPLDSLEGVDASLLPERGRVFAVLRFDRQPQGGRVHQEDFAQALEISPAHKYGDAGPRRTSYDALARLVRDAAGPEARDDFLDRLAFVVASGNGDAHLKNWTFQWSREHRLWLSPCYDLVATISWPAFDGWQLPGGPRLGLGFGRSRRFADIDLGCLRRFAERAHAPDAEARFLRALERIRAAWLQVSDRAPSRMRQAVKEHWHHVPLLRHIGLVG